MKISPSTIVSNVVMQGLRLPPLSNVAPNRATHAQVMKRLGGAGNDIAQFYTERIDALAHIIAGSDAPLRSDKTIDASRFLAVTGFDFTCMDRNHGDTSFAQAVNRHLLRMERGYARLFRLSDSDGAARLVLDHGAYIPPVDRHIQQRIRQLLPRAGTTPAQHDLSHALLDLYNRIIEHQDAASMMMQSTHTFLDGMDRHTKGVTVNAMQLVMMGKGLDVGTIDIAPHDRTVLLPRIIKVARADGTGTVDASVFWLLMKLNEFIEDTTPDERGVRAGTANYNGLQRLVAAAVEQPSAARAVIKGALNVISPAIFNDEHGRWVRKILPAIADLALSDANTAYVRTLAHNRQPFFLKTQYMDDVTATAPAWQRTVKTPGDTELTYAAIRNALADTFSSLSNRRYRYGVAETLMRLGISIETVDPHDTINNLPDRFIAVSNHHSYMDIGVLATLLIDRHHRFVAHDGLPAITLGIGSFIVGSHLMIERIAKNLPADKKAFIKSHSLAAYGRALEESALFIFPQGTRSRRASSWRDGKATGDNLLEEKYRRTATVLASLAAEHAVPILPVHLSNTGNAFMYPMEGLGDVLGVRARLREPLNAIKIPVFGTKVVRRIRADIHPLIHPAGRNSASVADELIAYHNAMENEERARTSADQV